MSDKVSFTDWILDAPVTVFFWVAVAIGAFLWAVVIAILLIYLRLTSAV